MKKACLVMVLLLVSALILSACKTTTTTTTTTAATTAQTTTQTTAQPKHGGTLKIIVSADTNSLYPPEQFGPEYNYQCVPCLETLVRMDEKGGFAPFLAESYEEDTVAKTITLTLRKGVKFHDGTVFDAQACKWNLDQLRGSQFTGVNFLGVSSIDVVDDYTVRVSFSNWDSVFLYNLTYCQMVSPTAFEQNGIDWARENPVGTGPFKLVTWQRDVQKVYERFDDYWQPGKPYLDKIIINIIADPMVQVASFLAGENDMVLGLNPTDAAKLKDNPDVEISQSILKGLTDGLMPDSVSPDSPFSNLQVRQAVSYAIDRQSIADAVFKGFAQVAYQSNGPACYSYNPNIVGYPYNLEKAKALLAEANYSHGFTTTLWCRSEQMFQDLYTAVQSDLAAVGIKVDLQLVSKGKYDEIYFGGGWPKGLFGADVDAGPEWGSLSKWFFDGDTCIPSFAAYAIHPAEINDTTKAINSAVDFKTKKSLSWELQSLVFDKYCIYIPLVLLPSLAAKSSKIHDEYTDYVTEAPWTFADAWMSSE
jgi:peptide/nickel transport system substrate-binding protein